MYLLDIENPCDQESIDMRNTIREIVTWIIDNKCTLRQASADLCIPTSTLHRYIHTYVREFYDEEYLTICNILKFNKKYRSRPKKYWYYKYSDMHLR